MIAVVRKLLALLLFCVIIISIFVYVMLKTDHYISKVDIVSSNGLTYISKQSLVNNVSKLSEKPWFDVDVKHIEDYLNTIKGVNYSLVKKIWPSSLMIYLYDSKPIAYWNNNQVLLQNMQIISPNVLNYTKNLPYIESDDKNSKNYIYKTYQKLAQIATQNSTEIVKISYKGNQFSLCLKNKIWVILGSSNLVKRMDLFFKDYQEVKRYKSVKYFDMRYSDGFVVKYK